MSRIKKYNSLRDKIKRKNYSDPIHAIKDFAGVRIVCGYESEFSEVEEIISRSFQIHEKVDKSDKLGVDKMGYHGRHYVVSLNDSKNIQFGNNSEQLCCEIQYIN